MQTKHSFCKRTVRCNHLFLFLLFLFPFLFLGHSNSLSAQATVVDSLKTALANTAIDTTKAALYEKLCKKLLDIDIEESLVMTEEYIEFAAQKGLKIQEAEGLIMKGRIHMRKGEGDLGVTTLEKALGLSRELRLVDKETVALYLIGACAINIGDFDTAKDFMLQAKALAVANDDYMYAGHTSEILGHISTTNRDTDGAIDLYDEAIAYFKKTKVTKHVLAAEYNKALLLSETQPNKAFTLLEQIAVQGKEEDPTMVFYCLNTLSIVYSELGDLKKAIDAGFRSLESAKALNNKVLIAKAHSTLSGLFIQVSFFDKAKEHILAAKELALEFDDTPIVSDIYATESNLYLQQGQIKRAESTLNEGLQYLEKSPFYRAHLLVQFAALKSDLGQQDTTFILVSQALDQFESTENKKVAQAWQLMGKYYLEKTKLKQAKYFAQKAFDFSLEGDQAHTKKNSALLLSQIYKKQNKPSQALEYFEIYATVKDSILNEENIRKVVSVDLNRQFEEEKQALEKTRITELTRMSNEKQLLRKIILAIAVLALIGFGFFWYSRQKNKIISQQNQELEKLNITKNKIFAIIGHDLRNPALAFRGITQKVNYLLKKQDYDTLDKLGDSIEEESNALSKLTDNLLKWASIQNDVMPYYPKQINVAKMTHEVSQTFKQAASAKKISLVFNIPEDLNIFADPIALNTIVGNLIDNAIKYSHEGGRIDVNALEHKEYISIEVKDYGVGIQEEKLKNIFRLHKNKSEPGTADETGTGLGMYLIDHLTELNKGKIKLVSKLGTGTSMTVSFPKKG